LKENPHGLIFTSIFAQAFLFLHIFWESIKILRKKRKIPHNLKQIREIAYFGKSQFSLERVASYMTAIHYIKQKHQDHAEYTKKH
jgi:hypothetical protein